MRRFVVRAAVLLFVLTVAGSVRVVSATSDAVDLSGTWKVTTQRAGTSITADGTAVFEPMADGRYTGVAEITTHLNSGDVTVRYTLTATVAGDKKVTIELKGSTPDYGFVVEGKVKSQDKIEGLYTTYRGMSWATFVRATNTK